MLGLVKNIFGRSKPQRPFAPSACPCTFGDATMPR